MRIIAGTAGRTRLDVPGGAASRPTTDRVREALFSILGDRVQGARVLDLFAGSGALGLEALSRGAASAVFVDQGDGACRTIGQNLARARLEGATVRKEKVEAFIRRCAAAGDAYDLIFADPPYRKKPGDRDHVGELLENADMRRLLAPGGWLVAEMSAGDRLTAWEGWATVVDRRYGDTRIVILTRISGA